MLKVQVATVILSLSFQDGNVPATETCIYSHSHHLGGQRMSLLSSTLMHPRKYLQSKRRLQLPCSIPMMLVPYYYIVQFIIIVVLLVPFKSHGVGLYYCTWRKLLLYMARLYVRTLRARMHISVVWSDTQVRAGATPLFSHTPYMVRVL